jgi:hypothetical protein
MLVVTCARFTPIALSFFVAAALALAACGGDNQATPDGGADAGPDSGVQAPECTAAEDCDDGDACTADRCDAELGCIQELIDGDDDGYAEGVCTTATLSGGDCNDTNETVYPGAPELCDQLDNDCDDAVDDETIEVVCSRDADGDGFGLLSDVVRACLCPDGYIPPRSDGKFDCVDSNEGINPGHETYETSGYCLLELCAHFQLGYDWDCSGSEEMQYPSASDGSCRLVNVGGFFVCRGSGWAQSIADCGDSDSYRTCDSLGGCSETIIPSRAQTCR